MTLDHIIAYLKDKFMHSYAIINLYPEKGYFVIFIVINVKSL